KSFHGLLELSEEKLSGLQGQVHYVSFPDEERRKIKVKLALFEQIDQPIHHVVAGNELHIDVEMLLPIASLFQIQRCSVIDLEVSDVRTRFSDSARVQT